VKERNEICVTIETVRDQFQTLVVRGLRSAGPSDIKVLEGMSSEFVRVGATHLATQLTALCDAVKGDDRKSSLLLMRAQTSLAVFERVLTLDTAAKALEASRAAEADAEGNALAALGDPAPKSKPPPPPMTPDERRKLLPILEELTHEIEELSGAGLSNATDASIQKLDMIFKEASRLKLLRLGASLRYVNEEVQRFLKESADFSAKRLLLFMHRSWVLAGGMVRAITKKDDDALAQLLIASVHEPVVLPEMQVVVLGIGKRMLQNNISFEFRMRLVADAGALKAGQPLLWSCLFANKNNVPAEAYLHLPQPQKFNPKLLTEGCVAFIREAAVVVDDHGYGRVMMGPKTTVVQDKPFKAWDQFGAWDQLRSHRRVAHHHPSPLDLPPEMMEEVVLTDWEVGEPFSRDAQSNQKIFPIRTATGLEFDAVVSTQPDGKELTKMLKELQKKKSRPPLFGAVYFELCRLMFQPLGTFEGDKMHYLMLSDEKINLGALLKDLNFR
jgi:hypothetical protein